MSAKRATRRPPHGFWLSAPMLAELRSEAKRLGLTFSEMAQQAWRIARESIKAIPDVRVEGEK